jgi:hypothetical protein
MIYIKPLIDIYEVILNEHIDIILGREAIIRSYFLAMPDLDIFECLGFNSMNDALWAKDIFEQFIRGE